MTARAHLALGILVCLTGCGAPAPYVVDEVHAPVAATLRVDWSRRDITVPWHRSLHLDVAGASFYVDCQNPYSTQLPEGPAKGLLAVEPTGAHVAARCATGDDWSVYVVAGADTFLYACTPLITGPSVDWSRVPPLDDAVATAVQGGSLRFDAATRVVEKAEGQSGLGRLLRAFALRELGPGRLAWDHPAEAAFVASLARVSPDDRAAVQESLRSLLVSGNAGDRLDRALRVVDLTRPDMDEQALGGFVESCGADDSRPGCAAVLRRYATVAPAAASRKVCERAGTLDDYHLGPLRLAIFAQAGVRCEPWAAAHEQSACASLAGGRQCPSSAGPHDCTRDDYRAEIAAELSGAGVPQNPGDAFGHPSRMITAAGRAMGLSCAGAPLGPIGPNLPPATPQAPRPHHGGR
jgi:hypothetical protein